MGKEKDLILFCFLFFASGPENFEKKLELSHRAVEKTSKNPFGIN